MAKTPNKSRDQVAIEKAMEKGPANYFRRRIGERAKD